MKLPIKPKGKAKKMKKKGKAKVKAEVIFTPDGGPPNADTEKVRVVRRG